MDKSLLKVLQDRETFYRFKDLIKPYTLSEQAKFLIKKYDEFFSVHENSLKIHADELLSFITHGSPSSLSEERYENLKAVLENIEQVEVEGVAEDIIKHYKFLELAQELSDTANAVIDGDGDVSIDDIEGVIEEYHADVGKVTEAGEVMTADLLDLFDSDVDVVGYNWRLHCLNAAAGPIRAGDLIHVYGRTNCGKTSLVISETSFMAPQRKDDRPILWFNNEEHSRKILQRYYACVLGQDYADLDREKAVTLRSEFENMCVPRDQLITRMDIATDPRLIEAYIKEVKPSFVVFNNLDKVQGFSTGVGNEAQRLGKVYQWARGMGMKYDYVTFSVGQANVEAEGKKNLHLSHMDQSKTGKPAELDLAIGIGVVDDEPEFRYINVVKNKLQGGTGTLREGLVGIANFDGPTGKYTDEKVRSYV